MRWPEVFWQLSRASALLSLAAGAGSDRALELELRAVVVGNRGEIIEPPAREILLGLDVLEHFGHAELLPLPRELERLLRGAQRLARKADLIRQRMHARMRLDDLPRDLVPQLVLLDLAGPQPRLAGPDAAVIEEPARPDPPPQSHAVVAALAEFLHAFAVSAAAERAV